MLVSAEPNTRSALAVTRKEENLRAKQWCEHCNKPYHTKSNCWKLHGKPLNWQPRNKKEKERPAYIATSMPAAASAPNNKRGMGLNLTADQVDFLQKLLNGAHIPKDLDGPVATTPAPSLAQRDKLVFSLTTRRINNSSWVVDTRASNHMIGSMTMFENFQLGNKDLTVLMADGTISSVKGKGKVCVAGLVLEYVLYVPNLKCSVLFVNKLTNDLNCTVIFFSSHCVFQDRSTGKMIGSAKEKDGLYWILDNKALPSQLAPSFSLLVSLKSEIFLWHRRLGHPSF